MAMTASERYSTLAKHRIPFLDRARHNALLTIPSLMRLEGDTGESHLYEPYNGLGSKGVLNVSNRVSQALMRYPFMKLEVDDKVQAELDAQGSAEQKQDLENNIAKTEKLIHRQAEVLGWRDTTYVSVQQLVCCGNVMEHMQPDGTIRVIRLDQFVAKRDFRGNLVEFVIEDKLSPETVPMTAMQNVLANTGEINDLPSETSEIKMYSWGRLRYMPDKGRNMWTVRQEINDLLVPGSDGMYEVDEVPYSALRWAATPGEDYGRSKVEEHIGDLRALESLEKSMTEHAAMAARNLIMIKPGAAGGGLRNRIARANNGDVLVGDYDNMKMLGFENIRGVQVTKDQLTEIRRSLAQAFLLTSAGQRDAERVTAREIDRDIDEIEGTVGGVFSVLAAGMMEWRTRRLVLQMQRGGSLPQWPKGVVFPHIVTGLEALTREREGQRSLTALQALAADPDSSFYMKKSLLYKKILAGLGLPEAANTEEEAQALQQARAQQEALSRAAGPAIQAAGRVAEAGSKTQKG